ncbi:hypothetical protein Ccrd_008785 [Cynara cardunculus var. scolymus]|uniref:Uncharacterized protein n=1 Tax=Cynara cardunculus var. scolymus TaxID=59895 RepID=A0A118JSU0_CYNCS|nr:hypothetical protein Ccrd_008785 [Cynara cardunculus var. scolymus]
MYKVGSKTEAQTIYLILRPLTTVIAKLKDFGGAPRPLPIRHRFRHQDALTSSLMLFFVLFKTQSQQLFLLQSSDLITFSKEFTLVDLQQYYNILYNNHTQLKAIGLFTTYFPPAHVRLAKLVVPDCIEPAVNVTVYAFFSFCLIKVNVSGSTVIFTARIVDDIETVYVVGVPTLVRILVYLTMVGALLPPPSPEAVSNGTANDGAASPLTCGHDIEVPDRMLKSTRRGSSFRPVGPILLVQPAIIFTPGAMKSGLSISGVMGFGPLELNAATTGDGSMPNWVPPGVISAVGL